jgi:hypothetical protein
LLTRVGGFVRRGTPVEELQDLASHFSLPPEVKAGAIHERAIVGPRAEAPPEIHRQWTEEYGRGCAAVEDILSECAGLPPFTELPPSAVEKFEALAKGVVFEFRVWLFPHPDGREASLRVYNGIHRDQYVSLVPVVGPEFMRMHDTNIGMTTPAERGPLVKAVVDYFLNPERDRLKRCAVCKRWFVDETRNKSQLRCSTSCTVAWWTRQRRQESGHAEYRRPRTHRKTYCPSTGRRRGNP